MIAVQIFKGNYGNDINDNYSDDNEISDDNSAKATYALCNYDND